MKRLVKSNEDSHTDRWLVSYADFITLMFSFFVVMYSLSTVNEGKYRAMSDSIAYAITNPSIPTKPIIINDSPSIPTIKPQGSTLNKVLADKHTAQLGAVQLQIEEHMKQLAGELAQALDSIIKENNVRINLTKRGIVVDISDSTLFGTGEATLQAASVKVLRSVAQVLSKEDMPVEIEGHTDDIPIATVKFPSNWELSSVRASSVARLLMENGVPEKRLSVIGLASNYPLLPNTSAENRSKNRRVTMTVISPNLDRE